MATRIDEDEAELQELVGKGWKGCAVTGCSHPDIDQRGSVYITVDDMERELQMCPPHWEGIFMVLGHQTHRMGEGEPEWTEEDDDAAYDNELFEGEVDLRPAFARSRRVEVFTSQSYAEYSNSDGECIQEEGPYEDD